jgi:pectate lyase
MAPVKTVSAKKALELVLASVGASLPKRDAVDTRLVNDVKNRTGKMINSQQEVGGWPQLRGGTAPADADDDGIADDWERKHGLNSRDASDAGKLAKSGYSNLEEYINGIR